MIVNDYLVYNHDDLNLLTRHYIRCTVSLKKDTYDLMMA
jgi:hypothetical protein